MSLKNPKECFCLRQQQTFFVLNELTMPTCQDGSEPLMFHHETFSRFKFVIINQDKKAVTANIPVSEFPGIFEEVRNKNLLKKINSSENKAFGMINNIGRMTQKLVNKFIGQSQQSTAAADINMNSPAFTLAISSGTLRGKTPAAALLENAEVNKPFLERQVSWLTQNLAKYPRNQQQIDAINQALDYYNNGLLAKAGKESDTANSAPQPADTNIVYQTGFRPLIRRKNKNGKCFVYEIKIVWHEDLPKPVEIEIRNYFAPVVQDEKGLLNVKAKEREDDVRNRFSLTTDEWFWMQHMIEAQISTFENIQAAKMYRAANEAERANKANAFERA